MSGYRTFRPPLARTGIVLLLERWFFLLFLLPMALGFSQIHSQIRRSQEESRVRLTVAVHPDGSVEDMGSSFFLSKVSSPPPPQPVPSAEDPLTSLLLENAASSSSSSKPFSLEGLFSFDFSRPQLPSLPSIDDIDTAALQQTIALEVTSWGQLFRQGAIRSWDEIGAPARAATADAAVTFGRGVVNSLQYFGQELQESWVQSDGSREEALRVGEVVGKSLVDLGPYIERNAEVSWESNAAVRESAEASASKVLPFIGRSLEYFGNNAAASWEQTGAAWRDGLLNTVKTAVAGFGPYFASNLEYSWALSDAVRPMLVFGGFVVTLLVALRQQKLVELQLKAAESTKANPFQPLFSSSVKNVQGIVDRTASNTPFSDLSSSFLGRKEKMRGFVVEKKPKKLSNKRSTKKAKAPPKKATVKKAAKKAAKKATNTPKKQLMIGIGK